MFAEQRKIFFKEVLSDSFLLLLMVNNTRKENLTTEALY